MKWSEILQFTPDERKAVLALVLFTAGGGIVLEVARRHPEWTPGVRALAPTRADSTAADPAAVDPAAVDPAAVDPAAVDPVRAKPAVAENSLATTPGGPDSVRSARIEAGMFGAAAPRGAMDAVAPPAGAARKSEAVPGGLVDLNHADLASLESLPGIGPAMARRIVEDRAAHGPYARPEDILRVKGIGPATLKRLRPFLKFSS